MAVDYQTNEQTCSKCGRWFDMNELWMGHCKYCISRVDEDMDRMRDE